jgi:outer membrane protein assembly factor BamB
MSHKPWVVGRALVAAGLLAAFAACVQQSPSPAADNGAQPKATSTAKIPPGAAAGDWPLFRGDPQMTGVAKSPLPEQPVLLWEFKVKEGVFEGTPAIVGGVAYLGDLDGTLYALDMNTGQKKWDFFTGEKFVGFNSAPAVKDGRVYIGDVAGKFYCLNAEDGKPVWGFETGAEINSSPNFYKDNVLVGSQDATLYCLNAKSGELTWKFAIDDQIRCSPTIAGNRCFLAGCDSRLHVIDLDKGEKIADVPIDGPTGVTPAVQGDLVFFGTEGGTFFAINWKEAKVAWKWTGSQSGQGIRSSPAVMEGLLVFGGRDKRLHALAPDSGDEVWEFLTRGAIDSSPVVAGNRIYFGGGDGRLYGVDSKSGEKVYEYEAGGHFIGSPAVAGGKLVIASDDGVVYCFGEKK